MAKIRLTKEFNFEMAHALKGYDGACRNIHGHSYRLFVTVIGRPSNIINDPKLGMTLDFSVLKNIVGKHIVDRYDHALILMGNKEQEVLQQELKKEFAKVEIVDYQPTCENMISRFADFIMEKLPSDIELHHIRLNETATSYAEWYAEDNLKS